MLDVCGQHCPDSALVYCTVSVRQNLKFSVGRVFECPNSEFELDFDRQTPHSNSGQNPDSTVRRRLVCTITFVPDSYDSKVQILEFLELFEVSSCPFFQILLQ